MKIRLDNHDEMNLIWVSQRVVSGWWSQLKQDRQKSPLLYAVDRSMAYEDDKMNSSSHGPVLGPKDHIYESCRYHERTTNEQKNDQVYFHNNNS